MSCLGIDIGGTNTKLVRLEDADEPVARHEVPTPREVAGYERTLSEAVDTVSRDGSPVEAVGFSVAGLVDEHRAIVQAPNLPFFEGVDVAAPLRRRDPEPVLVVENDVNAAIVGEQQCGAGRGCRDLCMLSLGTGVGGGVIVDGRLQRGSHGLAGELGHIVLDHDGPPCTCGLPGHVEAYLSTAAIVERGRAALREAGDRGATLRRHVEQEGEPSPRVLAEAAREGCPVAREVLAVSGRWLGLACANLTHTLQPDRILIGGGVSQADELLLEPAREEYEARLMRAVRGSVPIVRAELGVDGAAIGAAVLARRILDERRA